MAKKAVNPAPKQEQKSLEEALSKSEQFFENNKKTIFGCLIAIIVIIAGGMIYNAKVAQPRQEKASEAIFPGEESIDKPAQALKIYKLIKAKYPESNEGIEADKYIARLTSK